MINNLPERVRADLARARRLEWWTLGWMSSVVLVMWLVMGSSQAMKTALVEDVLSWCLLSRSFPSASSGFTA